MLSVSLQSASADTGPPAHGRLYCAPTCICANCLVPFLSVHVRLFLAALEASRNLHIDKFALGVLGVLSQCVIQNMCCNLPRLLEQGLTGAAMVDLREITKVAARLVARNSCIHTQMHGKLKTCACEHWATLSLRRHVGLRTATSGQEILAIALFTHIQ
jgi:hypothetical protein